MKYSHLALLAALTAVTSCGEDVYLASANDSSIRIINAGQSPLTVRIDGQAASQAVPTASVSNAFLVPRGIHQLELTTATGTSAAVLVESVTGQTATAVAVPNGASLSASVLADTGSVVPAGKSKLRVGHFASGGQAVEFWRTQPDFQTPVHIMTPFAYQATSPYLQSDPGNWEVFVTAPGGTAKLATTGPVNVPSGERRTVVLVDSAGVLRFRVIAE
ncbi:MAG: DUF4397 domain-containing protein [Gemmatimonadaceae bacterium]